MTFKEWCIQNDRTIYLELWDYAMNDFSPNDVLYGSKKKVYIKCQRGLHESKANTCYDLIRRKRYMCNQCNSFGQYIIDKDGIDTLKRIWGKNNDISPYDVSKSSSKMIWLKCIDNEEHGEYKIKCNTYMWTVENCTGCPKCHVRGKNGVAAMCDSLAKKIPEYEHFWSESNTIDPTTGTPLYHKIAIWKCQENIHDDFCRSISESVRYDFRCPICSVASKTSMLQNKVSSYFEELGFVVLHEYKCNILPERKWVRGNRYLPCDNEIVELKLIVEVNGKQHYTERSWHDMQGKRNGTSGAYEFMMQKKRDMFKKWYVITHGYEYLEIPYTSESDDLYKKIIDEKIKEITAKESVTTTA